MSSVNKVILVGNCGRDPEIRYLPSGQAVANISIATSSKRRDQNSGETIEDTQWHRITFYDKLAEIVGEYVKKGAKIYVEGRLKYGKYTDNNGVEKNTCDIIATGMQMLGGREDQGGDDRGGYGSTHSQNGNQRQAQGQGRGQGQQRQAQGQSGYGQGSAPRQGQQQRQQAPRQQQPNGGSSGFDDMDDDIPF